MGHSTIRTGRRCLAALLVALPLAACNSSTAVTSAATAPSSGTASEHGASLPPADSTTLFVDDFESGDLGRWTNAEALLVQSEDTHTGAYAARGTGPQGDRAAYALKQLSEQQTELYYRVWFKIAKQPEDTSLYLLRFRTARNASLLGIYVSSTGKLGYRNDVTDDTLRSATLVRHGSWHELQVHISVASDEGGEGALEIWFDGARVDALSRPEQLGAEPIDRVQLGENVAEKAYDVVFDDVAVATRFIDNSP